MDSAPYILDLLQGAWRIIEVVLIFSILVVGHEYGHFLTAKMAGMRVDEFGIGFGKRVFSWKRGETLYTINLVPIGGYNKIYGMDVEEAGEAKEAPKESGKGKDSESKAYTPPDYSLAPADDPRAFVNRPLHQRFFVVVSGPVANILVAVLVVFLMGITVGFPAAELGAVVAGGPADGAGLMAGDIITHLDGVRLSSTADLHRAVYYSDSRALRLKGLRNGKDFKCTVVPQPVRWVNSHFCALGFVYRSDGTVMYIREGSPAARSRLARGDVIIEIDGIRFPSHRLDINSGHGIVTLEVYRGLRTSKIEIEYFDAEFVRDTYNPFGFFLDEEGVITAVVPGHIADNAGLAPGDRIIEASTWTWAGSGAEGPSRAPGPLGVAYERAGETRHARLEPDPLRSQIKVYMHDASAPVLTNLPANHRLRLAGLRSGDTIVSIDGVTTPNGIAALLEFERLLGNAVSLVALSENQERVALVPLPSRESSKEIREFFAGLHFRTRYFPAAPIASVVAGASKAREVTRLIFMVIGMLVTREASVGELTGPVGIASITYQAASSGLVDLVNIMVLLSVNLAIFNLLPFPALDGGRILFMIPEAILGRPVLSVRVENIIHITGFALLILLAIFITYQDIARLISH